MLFQIYDYYRTVYGSEKGQDLIEYALLLAIFNKAGSLASDAATGNVTK